MTGCFGHSGESPWEGLAARSCHFLLLLQRASLWAMFWADQCDRATEMEVTMIGLQNAGKTSLVRVLSVSRPWPLSRIPTADS